MHKRPLSLGCIETLTTQSAPLLSILEGMCGVGLKIRILAHGTETAGNICLQALDKHPKNLELLEPINGNKADIIKKSDVLIFTREPSMADFRMIAAQNKIIITPSGGIITDYDAQGEKGEGFTYTKGDRWGLFRAIIRAEETRRFSYDWRGIQKRMKQFSVNHKLITQ